MDFVSQTGAPLFRRPDLQAPDISRLRAEQAVAARVWEGLSGDAPFFRGGWNVLSVG